MPHPTSITVRPETVRPEIVINVHGGVVQDVYCSDPQADVIVVDWDADPSSTDEPGVVQIAAAHGRHAACVGRYPVQPLRELAGSDVEQAIEAAGLPQRPTPPVELSIVEFPSAEFPCTEECRNA